MATIESLVPGVLQRLEETPSAPAFWTIQDEVRVFLVEALNEAMLISGLPELTAVSSPFGLTLNQTEQTVPSAAFVLTRIQDANNVPIQKTTLWDLDRANPTWESESGTAVKKWFPLGLTKFGVYPKITGALNVILSYIPAPVNTARPYNGSQVIPYQDEYLDGFTEYGAHVARLKEGTAEFALSMREYNMFIEKMSKLTTFATRIAALRFSLSQGTPAAITPVEKV